jgi:hypothetical protein
MNLKLNVTKHKLNKKSPQVLQAFFQIFVVVLPCNLETAKCNALFGFHS